MIRKIRDFLFFLAVFTSTLFFTSTARAADPWTNRQLVQQATLTLLLAADWAQTRDIKNHPNLREANPILGPHPTDDQVDRYFATAVIGHATIAHLLPHEWRDAWQLVWIGVEANTVARNYRLGVRFDLH